jgi:hypothetical protein
MRLRLFPTTVPLLKVPRRRWTGTAHRRSGQAIAEQVEEKNRSQGVRLRVERRVSIRRRRSASAILNRS